jgi:catechol 2,3-dioxygenase-like lactoylglutathione lyase family enzyme
MRRQEDDVPTFRESFPTLYAADVDRTVAFYRDAFGFELYLYTDDVDSAAARRSR